jgi:drug/metabolite transporter (DMT)-like permease
VALRPGTRPLAVAGGLAIVYVVWGSTYTGIAYGLETLPPLLLAGTRFLTAGAVLYAAVRLSAAAAVRPTRRHWAAAALTGTPLLVLGNGGVVWAQQRVASGIAALLVATVPLWIAALDRVAFGRRLDRRSLVGLVLGFAGIATLVDVGGGGADTLGSVVLVLAALGWASGTLLARGTALPPQPLLAAAMQMLAGGTILTVGAAATGELADIGSVSARSFAGWAYLVVFGSIVAFSAYGWLLRVAPTGLVATYAFVNPVVAVVLGWLLLGESVGLRELVAGSVIVAAVALIVTGTARAPDQAGGERRRLPLPLHAVRRPRRRVLRRPPARLAEVRDA